MSLARTVRVAVAFTFALASSARAAGAPPAAGDSPPVPLATAVKGLPGKGPLMARIDVEQKGKGGVKGTFTCTLYEDKAPVTVANFVALARGMRKWQDPVTNLWVKKPLYDGTLFHRVIPNFMIQGGDPKGTGTGTPGYEFDDEIKTDSVFDKGGLLAMANKGLNRATNHGTNGSQFFITGKETPWLNGRHTIFGLCEPLDLEDKIARAPLDPKLPPQANRPEKDIVIKKITISRGKK